MEAASDIDSITDLLVNQTNMNQSYPPLKNIQLLSSQKTKKIVNEDSGRLTPVYTYDLLVNHTAAWLSLVNIEHMNFKQCSK